MEIFFTEYEERLMVDSEILLAKNRIIKKIAGFFGELSEVYKEEITSRNTAYKNLINPKISRGENYLGLPYMILDFPRQFGKRDTFAIRSFFWWGNFFSITLHLSGDYQQQYASVIQNAIGKNVFSEWFIATGSSEWDHHFEKENYVPLTAFHATVASQPFLKLAKKIPLAEWDGTNSFFSENFKLLSKTLADYAPIR